MLGRPAFAQTVHDCGETRVAPAPALHLHGGGRPGLRAAARGGAPGSDVGTALRAVNGERLAIRL